MTLIQVAVNGRTHSVSKRRDVNDRAAYTEFSVELFGIAHLYFGAANTPDTIIAECYRLMLKNHATTGIGELRQAHELATKTGKFQAFNGMYTVNLFNEIMHLYASTRNKLLMAYDSTLSKADEAEKAENEAKKAAFRKQAIEWYEAAKADKSIRSWRDIPTYYANEICASCYIAPGDEALKQKAIEAFKAEQAGEADRLRYEGMREKAKNLMAALERMGKSELDMAKLIYRRMLVFNRMKGL
jgi:hypothetical protein